MQFADLARREFVIGCGAAAATAASRSASALASARMPIERFQIDVPSSTLDDLRSRLERTRWNDSVAPGWAYGTDQATLRRIVDFWLHRYQWPERQRELNRLPHFRARIEGFGVHFLHFRGQGARRRPLLLMNGWPSSFVEYAKLAPLLMAASGREAIDVVIPALPGFGFSDRPTRPNQVNPADLFYRLMTEALGYRQFAVAGTDIGARVATRLALAHPDSVTALHVATVDDPPLTEQSPPLTADEKAYLARSEKWSETEGAYAAIQSTRPQTLAFGLADSPVGLASWIVEKFHSWSDHEGDVTSVFPLETLVDNLMIYWVTETIGSSVRHYYERPHWRPPHRPGDRVTVPTSVLMLPQDLAHAPREWAERFYNVTRYTVAPRGGHFPAWEVPELYAAELISAVTA